MKYNSLRGAAPLLFVGFEPLKGEQASMGTKGKCANLARVYNQRDYNI